MKEWDISRTHRWIEPGPVVLVTTSHKGVPNIMTMGFHMMVEHEPPLIGCSIGPWDHSFKALRATKECVIAIPTVDIAEKVVKIGNCSGSEVDKFKEFKLTPVEAEKVDAPLIKECLANIECVAYDTRNVNKYGLWILKAVKVWWNPQRKEKRTIHHNGDGTFTVDGRTLNLKRLMTKWPEFL